MDAYDRMVERQDMNKARNAGERCFSLGTHGGELRWTYPEIPNSRVCDRHAKIAKKQGMEVVEVPQVPA